VREKAGPHFLAQSWDGIDICVLELGQLRHGVSREMSLHAGIPLSSFGVVAAALIATTRSWK